MENYIEVIHLSEFPNSSGQVRLGGEIMTFEITDVPGERYMLRHDKDDIVVGMFKNAGIYEYVRFNGDYAMNVKMTYRTLTSDEAQSVVNDCNNNTPEIIGEYAVIGKTAVALSIVSLEVNLSLRHPSISIIKNFIEKII